MYICEQGQRYHKPMTPFGLAVAASQFSRVCPGCGKQWASEIDWTRDTEHQGDRYTRAGRTTLRRHHCGGEMLAPGKVYRVLNGKPVSVEPPKSVPAFSALSTPALRLGRPFHGLGKPE